MRSKSFTCCVCGVVPRGRSGCTGRRRKKAPRWMSTDVSDGLQRGGRKYEAV
ncbi:hypothetical protein PF008_g16212 [Phytophthora fragariae]|uniref:Uncharacterized protein n=1 Tax=Phytophthora fragariae TaxID=53985 RepID=A0A6G0RCZ9_9STRA|nr:hypothetical protein PF008_g16212 [Phytophthora fragariae]